MSVARIYISVYPCLYLIYNLYISIYIYLDLDLYIHLLQGIDSHNYEGW